MALGTKTPNSTEEQDSAFNPAQKIFDERFNNTAAKLKSAEEQGGQIINDNADPTESIQDKEEAAKDSSLYSKKNNGNKKSRINGLLSNVRTRGPAMTMISIICGGGLSISLLLGTPATLFAMIKANLTNERNTAAPALHIRSMKAVGAKVTGLKENAAQNCEKPKSRLCKASTMSDSQKKSFEKAGMVVEVDPDLKPNGRNVIKSIELTDSQGKKTKVTTEAELNKALKNNPTLRSMMYKGFNPRTAFFLDNKFTKMLSDRFKTTKNKVINGDNDADLRKSFRESAGVTGEAGPDGKLKDRTAASQEKFKGLRAKASSLVSKGGAASFVCGTYDAARALTAGAKLVQITALVQFTMTFLREFDRTIAGDGDANVATFIGDRLTYSENNEKDSKGEPNRFYNTTAMDAEGMKMIFYGDFIKLSLFAQSYIVGGGFMGTINQWISGSQTFIGGGNKKLGKKLMASFCKASCASNVVNAVLCLPPASALLAAITAPLIEPAMKAIMDAAGAMPLDDETKGVDAGNAIAAGAGLMLGSMAMERGLKPTNKAGMKKYRAATEDIRGEILALEHYEAKSNPLDTTNQYSFLGSIAYNMYQQGALTTSPVFKLASIFSLVPRSLATVVPSSSALRQGFNQELEPYNESWLSCDDPSILSAQYNATQFCEPTHDMTETAMNVDKTSVIKFMTDGKYADEETGKPTDSEKGKLYAKYIKYCPERTNPIGETDEPVTEIPLGVERAEDGWQTAEYCGNPAPDDGGATQRELDMFSSDTMDISIDDAMEEAAPEATPESDGKWHFPTTVDTPTTSGFGPRGGTNHNGMDLANSIGTPIFAARDGTVVEAGPASGFGNWIVIQHDVDGKRVDTVYGHMAKDCIKVSNGQKVTGGQEIGCIGNEGQSTGPHLHFEIWEGGRFSGSPVDPAPTIEPLRGGS